jgi:8-oxo-dGTP diphosphatase
VIDLPLREGVRALVLYESDRVLLVRFDFPDGTLWATPGGGIEGDESHEDAIRRELIEEVGLRDVDLGPIIWERTHVFPFSPDFRGQHEVFFYVRVKETGGDPSFSVEELLAEGLTGSRWWTLEEMRASLDVRFAPLRLAGFLEDILRLGPPIKVIDTGV